LAGPHAADLNRDRDTAAGYARVALFHPQVISATVPGSNLPVPAPWGLGQTSR
jgi:hypothetical protein